MEQNELDVGSFSEKIEKKTKNWSLSQHLPAWGEKRKNDTGNLVTTTSSRDFPKSCDIIFMWLVR